MCARNPGLYKRTHAACTSATARKIQQRLLIEWKARSNESSGCVLRASSRLVAPPSRFVLFSRVCLSHRLLSAGLHCRRLAQACDRQEAMKASASTFAPLKTSCVYVLQKKEGLILIEVQSGPFFPSSCVSSILFPCNGSYFSYFRSFGRMCVSFLLRIVLFSCR